MENLYKEMRNLALILKEQAEDEFLNDFDFNTRELHYGLKEQEKQDKNYMKDLELENFYLAIRLLLIANTKPH